MDFCSCASHGGVGLKLLLLVHPKKGSIMRLARRRRIKNGSLTLSRQFLHCVPIEGRWI